MSRITDIAKQMKSWWNEDDDPFVHRALDEIIRIDQEQLPTTEPKRGRWIKDICKYDKAYHFKCSVCGEWNGLSVEEWNWTPNFCPNCGADMREREGE